jgi:sugar-specific transcriptional regulator TrmB
MEKILSDLGLSKNESKVYLALLRYGRMQLRDITKTTGLYRQNALESLTRLQDKGLVAIAYEGKRKAYSAVSPTRLRVLLEEKEKRLETLLPQLLSIRAVTEKPKIDILSGKEGLKTILNDEIAVGKTMHTLQSAQTVEALAGDYLSISREKRWRAGITFKIIYSEKDREFGEKARKYPKTQVRYLDEDFGPVTTDVYGDRTVLIFGSEPTILRITDEEVARRFLQFFKMNWSKARKK